MQSKQKNKRTSYRRITQSIRLELIQRVVDKGENIKAVIHDMGVNISTAKAILKVYQEEGRVGKKKKRDKVINVIQTYSFYTVDGANIQKIADTIVEQEKKSIQTLDNEQIENELKQKSKERAQELIKQAIERYNSNNQVNEAPINSSDISSLQNQMFYQYGLSSPNFPFCGIGNMPFK